MPEWLTNYARSAEGRERARVLGKARTTHGASMPTSPLHATYKSWQAMKARCDYAQHKDFPRYGGRGIRYDPRWSDFAAFFADMGTRPDGTTIDRIDSDGPYDRANCRWATPDIQGANRAKGRGYRRRPKGPPNFGYKEIACRRCATTTGTVRSTVTRWYCAGCRRIVRAEAQRRHRQVRASATAQVMDTAVPVTSKTART